MKKTFVVPPPFSPRVASESDLYVDTSPFEKYLIEVSDEEARKTARRIMDLHYGAISQDLRPKYMIVGPREYFAIYAAMSPQIGQDYCNIDQRISTFFDMKILLKEENGAVLGYDCGSAVELIHLSRMRGSK